MEARDLCYWLQGHLEINDPVIIDEKRFEIIRRHLELTFHHDITPRTGLAKKKQPAKQNSHLVPRDFRQTRIKC